MYRLLIVDDEYQTRRGLCELLDWNTMDIVVVGDAADGEVALAMLKELRPDILLTDVRMHRMDGLELARKARELLPGIGVVFISGYSDADYLRDALHVGAIDYIYKPIRLDELRDTMRRLVDRLDQQAEMRLLLEKSKPLLAERFLRSWFHGILDDKEAIRSKLALLRMHFPEDGGFFAAVFQPEWEVFPESGQAENCQILLEKIVRASWKNVLTCAEGTGVVALISANPEELPQQLDDVGRVVQIELCAPILIGVSQQHDDWLEAPVAAQEAIQAVAHQVFPTEDKVLFYEKEEDALPPVVDFDGGDLLERYVLAGNVDMAIQMLEKVLHGVANSAQAFRRLLICVALRVDLALRHQGIEALDSLAFCRQALNYQSVSAIKNSLIAMLRQACDAVEKRREQSYSPAVERVMEVIRTNYRERLSVNTIAEQVHYSPAHLSTLFRKETGITLNEAILRTRLKAAMDLLRTTLEPVSAIANRTGYADVQYFSRVFKQVTGFTPLEYRRKVLIE